MTANGKQKDPYYFTFFNEKNEEKDKDRENQGAEQPSTSIGHQAPARQYAGGHDDTNVLDTSMHSAYSNENIGGAGDQSPPKKSILTKPQLKSKSKVRNEKNS